MNNIKKKDLINQLNKNKFLNTENEICLFEDAIWQFVNLEDVNSIPVLIQYLDDDCDFLHVMHTIIHAMETIDNYNYVLSILENSSFLFERSPGFAVSILYRILNDKECLNILCDLTKNNTLLENIQPILNLIIQESPLHKNICKSILLQSTNSVKKKNFLLECNREINN